MLVKTLLEDMTHELITIGLDTSIDEAMGLMLEKNIGCLLVLDENKKLKGIVSDRDIFRSVHETKGEYHQLTAKDVMTSAIISGKLADEVGRIAWIMQKYYIRHLPILEAGELVGLISQRDILKHELETREMENRQLQQHMNGVHTRDRSADL